METTRTPGWYAIAIGVVAAVIFVLLGIAGIFDLQLGLGLAIISILVASLLYIYYMRGTAVSKTGFASLISILLIGLIIPFLTINQQQAQASETTTTYDLTLHRGAALFGQYCAPCHGYQGQGIIGPQLNGVGGGGFPPPDKLTDEELTRTISGGVPDPAAINTYLMPAWLNTYGGPLTQDDISYLVALIRSSEPAYVQANGLPNANGFDYVYASLTNQQQLTATAQQNAPPTRPADNTFVDLSGKATVDITAMNQPGNTSKWFWAVNGGTQANIIVSAGTKVTWANVSSAPHNVYSGYGKFIANPAPDGFKSDILRNGDGTFTFTFDKAGEYPFFCAIHPYMVGWITVR